MAQHSGDGFSKTVVLLKREDCERRNGKVYMPNTIEMAKIKKPVRGQYKTNVQFSKFMKEDMVRRRLQEEFPTFDLMNVRFSCAAVSQDSITFQFHGIPCVWDGRTIKRLLKGNSVLYIVMEYDQMDVSSGISASDSDSSNVVDTTEMSSLIPWLQNNLNFDVECNPNYSPLQGGGPCVFTFTPELHSEVTSVYATFEGLGTQKLEYLKLGYFPASPGPAVVNVTLKSQDDIILGKTQVRYGANLQQVVLCASSLKKFCGDYMSGNPSSNISGNGEGETENSRTLGCNQPVQMLSLLVYVAAEIGAQQFLEIMFTSSTGRVVFNSYKENLTLPEVIARDHGKEETANYLEDITKRFSDETMAGKECSQTIDWWELVKAAEAAEKQLDLTSEKEDDIPKETGYLGDIDTSSSESSEAQSSDSDDDVSGTSRKETRMKEEECKQPVWQHKDHAIEANMASITQSPILFLKDGAFPRGKANAITCFATKTLKWKENGLHLIEASCFQEAYNVREVKYLQSSGISFVLGLGNKSVQHPLITACQRLGYLLTLSTERNAYYKMHVGTAEDHQPLKNLSTTVGNVADYKASRLDALQQLCCRLINGEFTATANREDLTVRWKSAECLIVWVLTYIFRPTRKTLFVYVANSKDVFPLASCVDDRQYELSWECQQWQGCKNNVPKVQEIYKLPAIPPKITVWGRLALEGHKRALAEGKTGHKRVPVMLIGQDRSGRTSLKKSLRGEPFNPDEMRTIGIVVVPSHFKVPNAIWKTGQEDHNSETSISFECHAARASVENLKKETMVSSPEETEEHDSVPKDTASLRLALEGYIKIWDKTTTVMLVGQATSGKTSFTKSIIKPDEKSTMGIEVDPSHFKVSNEIWKTGKEDHNSETSISVECHAARATVENLKKGKMVPSPEETEEHDSVPKGNQGNRSDETSHNPEFVQAVRYTEQDDSIPKDRGNQGNRSDDDPESVQAFWYFDHDDSILKGVETEMVKRLVNDGNVDDEDVHSVLWDCGGQSVYYATHPIFLTSKASYLLVNDLSQNPNEKAKTAVKQGIYRKLLDSYCWKTNLDYLDFWISSIASLANQEESDQESVESEVLPEKLPPVLLVCKHADMPYENQVDPTTLTRELFGSLQNKLCKIPLHDLFVVGSECPEVVRLRQEARAVSKSLPQMKEAIPIKWLKYEKELQALKEGVKKCIDQYTVRTMASEACNIFDDQEFQTLLNFLHDKRIFIPFSDTPELDKLVVLDPQWLIDVLKEVIPVRPHNLKERKFQTLWNKREDDGILEGTLLESVWAPLVGRETFESVVGIMEKLILVCSWPSSGASCSKQYLVPSMLMSHPPESTMSWLALARIPPLFPKFESGQVPLGLFSRLVLQFFQWDQEEHGDPQLYHNFTRFFTSQNEDCSVILLCPSSSIGVVVHKGTNQDLADSLQSKLSCSADVAYDTCEVTCAHANRKKLELKLKGLIRSMCRATDLMIKISRGDFSSESKRCVSFFQWDQEEQGDPQLYHNFARFYTSQNEDCSVILLCPSSFIGVVVPKGTNQDLADSLQSKLSCSADVAYDTCEVTCAHAVRKKLELKLKGLIRSMCQATDLMIKISRGDFSSESKRCVSLTVDEHNGGNLCNEQESSVKRRKESPCTSQKRPEPMPEHLAVERDKMESNICQKLLEKEWRAYDVENIPRGIEGIYCIGVVSGVPRHFHLGEPTVLYVGRTNDVHRRLVEHRRQYLKIDRYVKEEFEDNGGGDLRIKWIKEKNQETKEKEYIECIAHKLGYWPKYNMRR